MKAPQFAWVTGFVVYGAFLVAHFAHAQNSAVQGARAADRDGFLANEFQRVDPAQDGWDTEVFHDAIKPKVKTLLLLWGDRNWDQATLTEICAPSLKVSLLRPTGLTEQSLNGGFTIRRPSGALSNKATSGDLKRHVDNWLGAFAATASVDAHAKIFNVGLADNEGTATIYIDATGLESHGGLVQQNATWETRWLRKDSEAEWRLSEIVLAAFEEVHSEATQPLFADCTEAVLAQNKAWSEQLQYGIDHWRLRIQTQLDIEPAGINGMAIGEANGDGLDDLFYTDSGGLPKRLFLHQADGSLKDVTEEAGLKYLDRSRAALFLDLDNDGDQDLAMALEDRVMMLANDGRAHFKVQASLPAAHRVHGLAAADFDRDGKLDLFACSYGRDFSTFGEQGVPTPWNDANNGAVNALFRNAGNWKFENATKRVGLSVNNNRFSFAACWDDFDRDGWPDLYIANDFGRNNLYRNNNGTFEDVAPRAGAEDISPGMACSWGDVNGDGYMDLQISNMFSGAGNRIAYQPQYKSRSQGDVVANHQRFARGNTLLINQRNGTFADHSVASGITLGRWAWGNQLGDVNNDGHLDSLVGNGLITGPEEDDL